MWPNWLTSRTDTLVANAPMIDRHDPEMWRKMRHDETRSNPNQPYPVLGRLHIFTTSLHPLHFLFTNEPHTVK
jgi:hypothetical protein